jgi:hypothetical protein
MSHITPPAHTPGRKDNVLAPSLERFRHAVAADFVRDGREWAEGLAVALARVEAAFRHHRAGAKAPDGGVLAEVDETSPTVARQADEVRSDHDGLLVQILALRDEVQRAVKTFESGADLGAIREQAEQLLKFLQQNKEAETTLLQEGMNTDVGGEN